MIDGVNVNIHFTGSFNGHEPERILYISSGGLGDAVMHSAAMQVLRKLYQNSQFDILSDPRGLDIIPPDVYDNLYRLDGDFDASVYDFTIISLRENHPDFEKHRSIAKSSRAYLSHEFPDDTSRTYHEVLRGMILPRHLGFSGEIPELKVNMGNISTETESRIREGRYIGMNIGCGSELLGIEGRGNFKKWSLEKWKILINNIKAHGENVLFVGGNSEKSEISYLCKETGAENFCGYRVPESARVTDLCEFFISIDSGPMHIAAAVKTPIIALFGPTIPAKNRPWTEEGKYIVITSGVDCQPCYLTERFLECKENLCMQNLDVEQILDAFHSYDRETESFIRQTVRSF